MGERAYSLYDIEQFFRDAGAERVGEDAVMDLEKELERLTEKLLDKALKLAGHAGRTKLIRRSDVLLTRKTVHSRPANFSPKARITNRSSTSAK